MLGNTFNGLFRRNCQPVGLMNSVFVPPLSSPILQVSETHLVGFIYFTILILNFVNCQPFRILIFSIILHSISLEIYGKEVQQAIGYSNLTPIFGGLKSHLTICISFYLSICITIYVYICMCVKYNLNSKSQAGMPLDLLKWRKLRKFKS